ncbi:alkaline phosphatase D family protein [Actinomadura gamaensis]|uniref:Alkaline phosphatase D family protein n=1 Tax=Actinomadura gamaensis TaxID=1763541 RepID=A0ABV9U0G3_9ACTN
MPTPYDPGRRTFLSAAGLVLAAPALATPALAASAPATPAPAPARTRRGGSAPGNPFTLGVASGDPAEDGVVLWTRLAPDPLNDDPERPGGMPSEPRPVEWQVAEDSGFARIVRSGTATATPELAHSVHVEVGGLRPGREYFYRFRAMGELSPAGRTRTAPAGDPSRLDLAVVSCQQFEHGYYTVYRHLADDPPQAIVHLGDYIYEAGGEPRARRHTTPDPVDLAGYRLRHAQYRTDPDLQAAHAAAPWIVTWDDHEVVNNYSGDEARGMTREEFAERRAGAYKAYYEHMPLRASAAPSGTGMRLYRRLAFGRLADLFVLDTRQYRIANPPDADLTPEPEANDRLAGDRLDPRRSMLGDEQERWLLDGLSGGSGRWRLVAQQVVLAQRNLAAPGRPEKFRLDTWDGFPVARARLLRAIAERNVPNLVVLTGDAHTAIAADLKADFGDPASGTLGSELVATSVTSRGDGGDLRRDGDAVLAANPHIRFWNDLRGHTRCTITPDALRAEFRVVPYVHEPGAPEHVRAVFRVTAGRPGLEKLSDTPLPDVPSVDPATTSDGIEG